ncbi:MAG: C10 family peptidase [Prevotella sp.]|nr:C10 family peptidase [Prevotella sp.]
MRISLNLTLTKKLDLRRVFSLLIAIIGYVSASAADITPQQALQQALTFVQEHKSASSGKWNTPTDVARLSLAGQVEGLYVFNVEDNGGFVVVANDDAVTPILGYSNSGKLDTANIPDNMRAWLKGYADEIAWAKATLTGTEEKSHSLNVDIEGSKPSAVKTPVAPLLTTQWNQREPYNNYCPIYDGTNRAATGCAATAMAQAMYYTESRAGNTTTVTTTTIPAFGLSTEDIPAGTTLNWADMIDDYSGSYTSAQADAVAQLMLYVGTSVKMNYGNESGANSQDIANALKTYFDYDTTTQFAVRSFYGYADWINILYHELTEGRPIVYGGQSSGGGHAFIIDGYQSEDYFHINWGWGGLSDDYFKLSVLNPYEQGVGGSTSKDGYHYAHEAIIGIKKSGDTGEVSELISSAKVIINLNLNSLTLDKSSITSGETVKVTLNVTNNGTDTYDGDLFIGYTGTVTAGKTFVIAPGETKDCVIDYTPLFKGTVYVIAFVPNASGTYDQLSNKAKLLKVTASSSSGTDNVELTQTFTVERAALNGLLYNGGALKGYNLLGNDFEATITLTNATSVDYTGTVFWCLIPNGESAAINDIEISVPANSTKQVTAKVSDLDYDKGYIFEATYVKNNSYSLTPLGFYSPQHVITTYAADGSKTFAEASASYSAPADALAVDVTGTSVTSVTPNSNPNTLYISNTTLSGLDGKNVVTYSGGTYSASNITLTDGNGFYSPVSISVDKAEFNYQFTVAADGNNGWNTLILPFDVTSVTADDKSIDWFHSSTDTGKNFWLKSFTDDDASHLYFDYVAGTIQAGTPYIVAFPGNKWGSKWDMSSKTIKFIGENTTIMPTSSMTKPTGSYYMFVGSTTQDDTENIYCLNATGNAFNLNATGGSSPFRAYFKANVFDRTVTSLGIGSGNATAIEDVNVNGNGNVNGNYATPVKVIKNGRLYIGNYNVAGARVK